jgi:4-diphosphocytidyl-2-C-methyl-D-erythritol kinase
MMRILSPAKINLHLRVGPRAPDGFHPLLSWMCTVGLHDTIEMTTTTDPGIHLTCDHPDVPIDATNLIIRAGQALNPNLGAEVSLQKKIPLGGGLGGGSSNAAFALTGFNQLWNLNLSNDRLAAIASQLGSDVPFFLHGPSSICEGRGQLVTPIPPPKPKFVVLILPQLSMPTPAVYKKFDDLKLGSNDNVKKHPDWNHWTTLPAKQLLPLLINDLEPPAFSLRPDLADLRTKIESQISRPVRMSGSGSSLFTLANDSSEAQALADSIRKTGTHADPFQLAPHSL